MTVVETDRIDMADRCNMADELTLDTMFEMLERMPVPEGYKAEIVQGNIYMSPQRQVHWEIILGVINQLQTKYPPQRLASDVRIDFPGLLNGFACDVAAMAEGATQGEDRRWKHADVDFVVEVISQRTAVNDFGPKKDAYAEAAVPVYLIVNPYTGRCHVYTEPKKSEYTVERIVAFGEDIDLTETNVGLILKTDAFPRD